MVCPLLFWDVTGNVIATLDHVVDRDQATGTVRGLVDFEAHELAGDSLKTTIATHSTAVGAGTWPVWLGSQAHEFRAEIRAGAKGGTPLVTALVHRISGFRMERATIDAEIAARKAATPVGEPADLRDIVGGPTRPILLDAAGIPTGTIAPETSPPFLLG